MYTCGLVPPLFLSGFLLEHTVFGCVVVRHPGVGGGPASTEGPRASAQTAGAARPGAPLTGAALAPGHPLHKVGVRDSHGAAQSRSPRRKAQKHLSTSRRRGTWSQPGRRGQSAWALGGSQPTHIRRQYCTAETPLCTCSGRAATNRSQTPSLWGRWRDRDRDGPVLLVAGWVEISSSVPVCPVRRGDECSL